RAPRGSPDRSPSAPTRRRSRAARPDRGPSASRDTARRTDRRRRGAAPRAFHAAAGSVRSRPGSYLAAPRPEQIRLDQGVQIAVHHGVDVAHLVAGPVVLDQLIGMERVRADLAAEGDLLFLTSQLGQLLALLLLGDLVKPRLEDAHRRVAIPELRAFVLALDDDPGRQVRDAYGRVGGVDPLPARPRCAEHVQPE